MMALDVRLSKFARLPHAEQEQYRGEIVALFREWWATAPPEGEFTSATEGLVWWPELQYIMVTQPIISDEYSDD